VAPQSTSEVYCREWEPRNVSFTVREVCNRVCLRGGWPPQCGESNNLSEMGAEFGLVCCCFLLPFAPTLDKGVLIWTLDLIALPLSPLDFQSPATTS
jgi:hypothetical protein